MPPRRRPGPGAARHGTDGSGPRRSAAPPDGRPVPADDRDRWLSAPPRCLRPRIDPSGRNRPRRGWHRAATGSPDRRPSSAVSSPRRQVSMLRGGIERAVEYPEICVTAAGGLQQTVRLGQRDALLDLVHGLGKATRARERNTQRIVGLRPCRGGLVGALGSHLLRPSRLPPRREPARPTRWRQLVAGPKREPADFLEQLCALDRIAVLARAARDPPSKQALARSRSPASQCSPPILR